MKIVDAQIHLWTKGEPSGLHRQHQVFTLEQAMAGMDAAGVAAAVIHPPSWDPDAGAMAADAVRRFPDRFAILGNFPPTDPSQAHRIPGWRDQPGMLGLRWALLHAHEQELLHAGKLDWIWPEAERAGVPVAMLGGLFLPAFRRIAEAHPNLKLVLDHCGLLRTGQDDAAFAQLDELCALAKLPNVAVKATGAPHYSTKGYPFRNIQDGLHRIFDAYGPKRFFWGTDITRMPISWRQCVTFFTEELPWLQGNDLEWVMGRGVCDWFGWKLNFD